jgi:hypothetical protein
MYQVTLGKLEEPTDDDKYVKWINMNDEKCELIGMSISPDLRFHLQGLDAPNKAWENLEYSFSSSSHGHALSAYGFSFNANSTSSYDEWLIDSR